MQRRDFMQVLAVGAGGLILPGSNAWAVTRAASDSQRKLIVIMLRGAVDGLSVVAPYGDANYARLRPNIAIARPGQENGLLDLDGYFGMHPALRPLQDLWQQQRLAFVHASGSPDATRSHFDAQDYLESGTPGRKGTQDGWMNRLLAALPGPAVPTRAISIGPVMPRILSGHVSAINIASGAAAGRPTLLDRPQVAGAFDQLYGGNDKYASIYHEAQTAHKEMMSSLDEENKVADGGAPLPNGFPADAARLASLMKNDGRIQFAFVALGGWDTHANQGNGTGQLANRLAPLGQGLATLAQRLGPVFDDTTIVAMSEFGRTARQNGNNGTDHGHGNVMWVLGGKVAGGKVYGDWQGLGEAQLHEGRDVPVSTDFRAVLAQISERHLKLSDKQLQLVFPDLPPRRLAAELIRAG
ncbi:uncharacterized protein (DUF1501 family) [Actimicrobium sp. GrIS 1.19]|uniref:DUF1501 domain-containing protein n=1 Tax=Actimicrobium sp. GrIS 1.19 TaxID=3071708 RepID=UPI002E052521|nr:uncharacterized protein (DUF1501 family) [Actimicrobium sp. GrIS 1.19]